MMSYDMPEFSTFADRNECSDCKLYEQEATRLHAELRRLEAIVDKLRAATSWQPMATAPKDGTEVLLRVAMRAGIPGRMLVGHWMPGGHCIEGHPPIDEGWYFWTGGMFDTAAKPTHWMPLPDPRPQA